MTAAATAETPEYIDPSDYGGEALGRQAVELHGVDAAEFNPDKPMFTAAQAESILGPDAPPIVGVIEHVQPDGRVGGFVLDARGLPRAENGNFRRGNGSELPDSANSKYLLMLPDSNADEALFLPVQPTRLSVPTGMPDYLVPRGPVFQGVIGSPHDVDLAQHRIREEAALTSQLKNYGALDDSSPPLEVLETPDDQILVRNTDPRGFTRVTTRQVEMLAIPERTGETQPAHAGVEARVETYQEREIRRNIELWEKLGVKVDPKDVAKQINSLPKVHPEYAHRFGFVYIPKNITVEKLLSMANHHHLGHFKFLEDKGHDKYEGHHISEGNSKRRAFSKRSYALVFQLNPNPDTLPVETDGKILSPTAGRDNAHVFQLSGNFWQLVKQFGERGVRKDFMAPVEYFAALLKFGANLPAEFGADNPTVFPGYKETMGGYISKDTRGPRLKIDPGKKLPHRARFRNRTVVANRSSLSPLTGRSVPDIAKNRPRIIRQVVARS